jgi:hypothetical protein
VLAQVEPGEGAITGCGGGENWICAGNTRATTSEGQPGKHKRYPCGTWMRIPEDDVVRAGKHHTQRYVTDYSANIARKLLYEKLELVRLAGKQYFQKNKENRRVKERR